jgi:RNA polymerase sigma factor (sigma-70 family)
MYVVLDGEEVERALPIEPVVERDVLLRDALAAALAMLPERERFVVEQHFDELTNEAIGLELGISRERTRQILDTAFDRIARFLAHRGVTSQDL